MRARNRLGESALRRAARWPDLGEAIIQLLLYRGVDIVNDRGSQGQDCALLRESLSGK